MTVVTLNEYRPLPRADHVAWISARIQEAPTSDGPWTLIDTVALAPVDTDPEHPLLRSFTSDAATLDEGWYRVIFADATGATSPPTSPVPNVPRQMANRPTVRRVAAILRVRPKTAGGTTLDTFTEDTNPTAEQVEQYIDEALGEVMAQTGTTIPEELADFVAGTVAVRAAQFVELGYPEVLGTARTSFTELETIYKDRLPWLLEAIQEAQEGDVEAGGGGADAAWGFPAATWGFIESERA
jgi:hypothetical protein